MKILVLTLFTCIATTVTFGQQSIRWSERPELTWEDFLGKTNDTSKYDAECFAEICYNYKFYNTADFEFDVYAKFDKETSWSRSEKRCEALLRHEQMHFNIAELFAEKLKNAFESTSYTASYSTEVVDLFNGIKAEYQATQLRYDEETNHSLNKEKQRKWEDFIVGELRKTRLSLQFAQNTIKDKEERHPVSKEK